jgi:hypothetical protein
VQFLSSPSSYARTYYKETSYATNGNPAPTEIRISRGYDADTTLSIMKWYLNEIGKGGGDNPEGLMTREAERRFKEAPEAGVLSTEESRKC